MEINNIDYLRRVQKYVMNIRPVFRANALFSDETGNYVNPMEPEPGDTLTIRFRAARDNIDFVYLVEESNESDRKLMQHQETIGEFDFYKIEIPIGANTLRYYFEIHAGKICCYYNKQGVSKRPEEHYSFSIAPGFKTPDWAKGAVVYQIFVDRFCNGDPSNDVVDREYFYIGDAVKKVKDWNQKPAYMGVREFYGGDLQGVWDKLDYLQDLGVDVIYFNPIFVSPSNHKYDIQDYDYVDPHFGRIVKDGGEPLPEWLTDNTHASKYIKRVTSPENLESSNAFFAELVAEIHKRGMKVILDGVFNHCGSFNKWLDRVGIYENQPGYEKGAYVSADSPYRSFFRFTNEYDWPYNRFYDGWWGHDTLPKLAYENSEKLYQYIMDIAKKWVSPPYQVDGWRLDVAADLGFSNEYNHKFWKDFRRIIKEANPDALILAEHYGDAGAWLKGDEWDTVMNYDAFMEPITWFFTGMEKHSDEYRGDLLGNHTSFISAMRHHMADFLAPSLQVAMNELSNHDHSRFLTRTNHYVGRVDQLGHAAAAKDVNEAVFREAITMQMTWPGAPTIYYGDEAGAVGFTDPDNRRTYPWGYENHDLIMFHKEMIKIHKAYPVLIYGSIKLLSAQHNHISYARFSDTKLLIMAFNNGFNEIDIKIPVWLAGANKEERMVCLMRTDANGFSTEIREDYIVNLGHITVKLGATSAVVLIRETDL